MEEIVERYSPGTGAFQVEECFGGDRNRRGTGCSRSDEIPVLAVQKIP